ncbi:MAG: ATP-binding protein [Thermoanaerobaculia bacterium]
MVPVTPSRLTPRVGFRRDIRLFFGLLAALHMALIVILIAVLQTAVSELEDATMRAWNATADAATADLAAIGRDDASLAGTLEQLREKYDLAGVRVEGAGQRAVDAGRAVPGSSAVVRQLPGGKATFFFDGTPLQNARSRAFATGIIAFSAAVAASILLFLYVPRIVRPFEELLEAAGEIEDPSDHRSETDYLVSTFRNSVSRLRGQEAELKRLHDAERTRADDLQRVTAALTRSLTSGFIAVDPSAHIVDMNAAAREILRLDADTPPGELESTLGANEFTSMLVRSLELRSASVRQEVDLARGDESIAIGVTTVPLASESDAFLGMLAIFTDLTPIRTLERRVREMQTLADLGEISAGIAHEFRNSLATVTGYLTLAQRDDIPDTTRQRIANAAAEAAQLSGAVQRFLTFARPMEVSLQTLDLHALVAGVAESVRSHVPEAALTVRGGRVLVEADPVLLPRAFDNLIRNAMESVREANRPNGFVTVTVQASPPSVTIEDNGVGLDPADVPRLFLPFQSTKSSGFGLGLSLVRKIVLLHGADVTLTGVPGAGARARVSFASAAG